jgi:hypothetical protein
MKDKIFSDLTKKKKIFSDFAYRIMRFHRTCRVAMFSNQKSNLGKFWRALQWKMLDQMSIICTILRPFDRLRGHLVFYCNSFFPVLENCNQKNLATLRTGHVTNIQRSKVVSSIRINVQNVVPMFLIAT